jgi:hypothetical protein
MIWLIYLIGTSVARPKKKITAYLLRSWVQIPPCPFSLTTKLSAHFVITVSIGLVYSIHDSTEEVIRKKMTEAKRRYYYETFSEIGLWYKCLTENGTLYII